MVGHGGSSAGSYLADPTSPIPSHCASIVTTSTVRVNKKATCIPVIYFSYPELPSSLPQADACSGGMRQNVTSNGLLRVRLETEWTKSYTADSCSFTFLSLSILCMSNFQGHFVMQMSHTMFCNMHLISHRITFMNRGQLMKIIESTATVPG